MGINVIAKDIDAEATALFYATEVTRGLEAVFFTNTSADRAARNYAQNKDNGVVVGNPAYKANSTEFKASTNYLNTQVAESLDMTLIFIAKSASQVASYAARGVFISSYNGGATGNRGLTVGMTETAVSMFYSKADGSTASLVLPAASTANYKAYALRLSSSEVKLQSISDSSSVRHVVSSSARKNSLRKLLIGSNVAADVSGTSEFIAARIHSVALDDDELYLAANELIRYAASKGITITY